MSKQKFWNLDATKPSIVEIKTLRQEVSSLITINNAIIEQLWDIDRKLVSSGMDDSTKEDLLKQKQELTQKIEDENFAERILNLKKHIHDLEIKEFGESDVLSNSPGNSNRFI
ncbi:hypothetical protein [Legionella bononiensis]|uniref:hypothetical protein n=1 Tax=Legionella bononiensis TaxID=2793102 RepID=UPI00193179E8|nr:hypothetical protein [Legionella bononiensis]MBL7480597.1 hypothetical protein [Legionella bononiensis]